MFLTKIMIKLIQLYIQAVFTYTSQSAQSGFAHCGILSADFQLQQSSVQDRILWFHL